ncbi:flagellar basal-body rod protein FlgG [Clostridia bacterium]|nr:flagellar basal-body rod protein FlgG [Clostridia bacterium]
MMRSLYSGVSGLRSHQTRMDVIGANIANVNTVGFKSSRVTFRDVLYQSYSSAGTPTVDGDNPRGGTNPYQIGLGVQVASIDMLNTRAGPQTTDRPLDCYIDGEGYFRVQDPKGIDYYTRVGNFFIDAAGRLVDSNGNFVLGRLGDEVEADLDAGYEAVPIHLNLGEDATIPTADEPGWTRYTQIAISTDGIITGYDTEAQEVATLAQIVLYKFPNNDALEQQGNTYLLPTNNSGEAIIAQPGLNGTGKIATARLEMSNVDLSKEFTDMIVTQRGFQANSRIITVSDSMLEELVNLKR